MCANIDSFKTVMRSTTIWTVWFAISKRKNFWGLCFNL